jgi:hypothetical protein
MSLLENEISYIPRRQNEPSYSLDFGADYASDALRCAIHKSSAREIETEIERLLFEAGKMRKEMRDEIIERNRALHVGIDQRGRSWPEDFVLELGLEGVPVVAAVLALVGVAWTISAVNSHDRTAYIFPAIYMVIGFGMLFFVSNSVRKRFRRARRQPGLRSTWGEARNSAH